jgi:nicotinamidase/pyrazinamidase
MGAKEEKKIVVQEGDALSVTDMQADFLPGGALAVPEGDKVIAPLNRVIGLFHRKKRPIFFTRDWHPPDHMSFKRQGGPWPPHCVQNTPGARFHGDLKIPEGSVIISKADKKDVEEYSTLYGRDKKGNSEKKLLEQKGIGRLFIGGLATDYCVLNTVKEAREIGLDIYVLTDAVRAVDVNPGDGEKALEEMKKKGAKLITTENLV